jgi:hypothetical protein
MKVLAVNSNYQNQNYKKKNVNFEAVRVDADAIKNFKKVAPVDSLTEQLMFWTNRNFLGKKVGAMVRAITGIQEDVPLEKVFKPKTGFYDDVSQLKQDVFVRTEYNEGELGRLQSAIEKAKNEVYIQMPFRDNPDVYKPLKKFKMPEEANAHAELAIQIETEEQLKVFDQLWDEEGTECNKLQKLVKGFWEDANSEGHHVTQGDTLAYAAKLAAHVRTYEEAKKGIDEAKNIADKTVTDEMIAKWFAPKPAAEAKI